MTRSEHVETGSGEAIGLWGAVSIGVGGMVGGGIFAVLGLAVQLTGGGAPLAFAIAGAVAALTAVSYARLSVRYPNRGGTTTYLNEAFGTGLVSGGLNILVWLSYIVMLSLYASAFGNYFVTLLPGSPPGWAANVALSAVILGMTALNAASAAAVGRAEEWIVSIKILILVVFVGAGLTVVDPSRLAVDTWAGPLSIAGGGMLIFVAYEGFELIANASEDMPDPKGTLPRAFAVSVGGVTLLYVLVAVVTVGVLTLGEIQQAEDFALAEAARPRFGQAGFTIIGIAAVLSTASAINATLYGATRLTYSVAESGELPAPFGRRLRGGVEEGLVITSVLTLLIANTVNLSRISTIGSVGFLVVFGAVNLAAIRLRDRSSSGRTNGAVLSAAGLLGCVAALIALFTEAVSSDPVAAVFAVALPALALAAEASYRRVRGDSTRRNRGA